MYDIMCGVDLEMGYERDEWKKRDNEI